MRTTILLAVLVSLAACRQQSEESARESLGSVRAEIDRIRKEWQMAAERDDAAAVAQLFAKDAVVIDPVDYAPVQGREAIQKVLTEELPIVSQLELWSQDFHASGDLAYDYGEFTEQVTPARDKPITIRGHYLIVLRRQDNGAWKLVKKLTVMRPRELMSSSVE